MRLHLGRFSQRAASNHSNDWVGEGVKGTVCGVVQLSFTGRTISMPAVTCKPIVYLLKDRGCHRVFWLLHSAEDAITCCLPATLYPNAFPPVLDAFLCMSFRSMMQKPSWLSQCIIGTNQASCSCSVFVGDAAVGKWRENTFQLWAAYR